MGAHVFPYHLPRRRDLEDTAEAALTDQRIAVWQPLRPRDIGAEEVEPRGVAILPHNLGGVWIDLDHPREGYRMVLPVGAVIEDKQVAVRQWTGIVLLGKGGRTKLPDHPTRGPFDDGDGGDVAEAHDQVAVGQLGHRVAVGPLLASILRGDAVGRGVHVCTAVPLPHDLAAGRHLHQIVGVHIPLVLRPRQPALDLGDEIARHFLQTEQDDVPIAQLPRIMVVCRVPHLPEHPSRPVHLHGDPCFKAVLPGREPFQLREGLATVEQVPILEQIAVEARWVGELPCVHRLPLHIDQVHGAISEQRGEQGIAIVCEYRIVGCEARPLPSDLLLVHRSRGHPPSVAACR